MTERDSTRVTPKTQKLSNSGISTRPMNLTQLCDAHAEMMALNYFTYDVMEALHRDLNKSQHHEIIHLGLMQFLRFLRMKEEEFKDDLMKSKQAAGG